ncbi:MAG: hypothetical protein K6T65_14785 [Peptococcaceae bacterium]|nr:hypothetical protein [Peptococcaceae bacterium]
MKYFRVKFGLPDDIASAVEKEENKARFIAAAVEWYVSHGKESLERLKKIEAMLAGGIVSITANNANNRVDAAQKDEIDDAFDDFVL